MNWISDKPLLTLIAENEFKLQVCSNDNYFWQLLHNSFFLFIAGANATFYTRTPFLLVLLCMVDLTIVATSFDFVLSHLLSFQSTMFF